MATREELQAQLEALDAQDQQLKKYIAPAKFAKTKVYNGTKIAIAVIVVFLAIIGTLGSMKIGPFASFDMDSFTDFIKSYQGIFITLTGTIGVGGIAKNVLKAKEDAAAAGLVDPGDTPIATGRKFASHAPTYSAQEELVKKGAGV
jgi:tartrate dehydratase beta subunit/fumarate hydratase class I family protein